MKVLILIDAWFPFTGGAQVQIKNLKEILEEKYKCRYYILHSPSANIIVRFLWSFWVIPQASFLHLKYRFNLIHAHAYWPGVPGKILSGILKIPIVFTVHGSNLLDLRIKSPRAFLEKIILTKIKYNQIISVASNFLKYKNVNKNIIVIANGVNIKEFESLKVKKLKRKPSTINYQPLTILFVGRDDPVKGLVYLKKAMVKVKKEFPKAELKIIKKGYSHKKLIKEYLKADVFVLPSLSEGQPLTLLEAWAAKLPVVVTAVGDNPKMVKNGVNGYIIKPGNVNLLTEAILKTLKNKKRDLLGKRGYQLVKSKYTWQKCAERTYEIYQKALSKE